MNLKDYIDNQKMMDNLSINDALFVSESGVKPSGHGTWGFFIDQIPEDVEDWDSNIHSFTCEYNSAIIDIKKLAVRENATSIYLISDL